jgi:antitoxin YefM
LYKIYSLLTAPISDFRKDLKRYLDKVTSNFETLVINRGKDNGVVIMSLSEYNSLCAKNHELSSRKNEDRLDKAILNVRKGDTFSKSLLEE